MASERAAINKRLNNADNVKPVPEIDWAHYERILGKDAVAPLKAEYEATPTADLDSEVSAAVGVASAQMDRLKSNVSEIVSDANELASEAGAQLAVLERSRTDEDTTLEEVLRRYPDIYNTLMKNIEEENYDTNFPALDLAALRLATVKENWDAGKFGPLDENTLSEVLTEMDGLEGDGASSAVTYAQTSYADLDDADKAEFAALHETFGLELTEDLIASYDAQADPRELTAAESNTTDEGELVQLIQNNLDASNPNAYPDKAMAIFDHLEALRASGDLVANQSGVANARANAAGASIVAMTEEDFAGKSVEDLAAAAAEAEASGDFYRASMYLYEAHVANGDIDPTARDNSFSGTANMCMQMSDNLQELAQSGRRPQYAHLL